MEKVWYTYIHRKPFNNEIFYVGIGCTENFKRAFERRKRNNLWKNIVNRYGFVVEIVGYCLTRDQAVMLEKGVIKILGRRDLDTGILSNMTIGGDGVSGKPLSEEHKLKLSKALSGSNNYWYGKKLSKEHRNKISKSNINNMVGDKHPSSKIVLDLSTGIFYFSAKEASIYSNYKYSTLKSMLNGTNKNKTSLVYI